MAARAEAWTPDTNACNQEATTIAIVSCLDARTKLWDARLNQAWKTLTDMLKAGAPPAQLDALKSAQRAWLKYRDLNCGYYETQEGTIRQIEVASCLRDMTQARAIELQLDGPQQ